MRTIYQNSYGPDLAAEPLEWVDLLEQTGSLRDSVYEFDYRQMTREDWKVARHSFDLAYIEFKDLLMPTWAAKVAIMNP